jgi:DNA modification methylase
VETRKLRVEFWLLSRLLKTADEENPKDHDIGGIEESITRWGFTEPVTVNEHNGKMLAGHGRIETLEQMREAGKKLPLGLKLQRGQWAVPVLRGVSLKSRDEVRAYLIAVNRLTERGGWSLPKLATALQGMLERRVVLTGTGFSVREAQRVISRAGVRVQTVEPAQVERPKQSRVKRGDVWLLGDQRVACGDSRDRELLARLMGGELAELLMADPPYGMGKGFESDSLQAAKLDKFQLEWWANVRAVLKESASCYVWGNAEDLWRWWFGSLQPWLADREQSVTMFNEVVWDKEFGNGQGTSSIRSYPMLTERALFFALGRQGFGNKNQDRYWEGWDEIRGYLEAEAKAAELDVAKVKALTGTNMFSHWFGKSQWTLIAEKHYATLQKETGRFRKPWEKLSKLHGQLLQRFNEWLEHERSFFDATHDSSLSDVWRFPRVDGAERFGHETPKPVAMLVRILRSSLRAGGLVLEPFGGTGPALLAAEQTGRRCCTVELDPLWCEVILMRWEGLTGRKAQRLETPGGG